MGGDNIDIDNLIDKKALLPTLSLSSGSVTGLVEGIFEYTDSIIIKTPVEKITIGKEDYESGKVSLESMPESNILMISLEDKMVVLVYNELSITINK